MLVRIHLITPSALEVLAWPSLFSATNLPIFDPRKPAQRVTYPRVSSLTTLFFTHTSSKSLQTSAEQIPRSLIQIYNRLVIPIAPIAPPYLPTALEAALTSPTSSQPNDFYDVNDPETPTPAQRQRQPPPRRTHIEATSPGISPPPRVRFEERKPGSVQLAHDFDEDLATSTPVASTPQQNPSGSDRPKPHRALRISRNTASAILYALEEALRHPNPFTPDLVEENASMSDLVGGRPAASTGGGRTGNNGNSGPQIPPAATGSPSGIKGPREVMRQRQAREERRRAEQEQKEALERARAQEDARLIEEEKRKSAERRAAGAAGQQRGSGEGQQQQQRTSGASTQRVSGNSQQSDPNRRSGDRDATGGNTRPQGQTLQGVGSGGRAIGGDDAGVARPRTRQPQARPVPAEGSRRPTQPDAGPSAVAAPSNQPAGTSTGATRSSFPHAFERWETLSAHWEGLTSFWIRRLEENSNDINRDPLSQQLSRQVTDLSAAGANLFHAVVELQRLRASSERKFQRWFFETRAEQERAQEIQALTEATLEQERRERAAAIAEAVANERDKASVDKQLAEMKRELQISKEEARRAWEELGRREQEERERTASLREGQPTLVGGVQVVPMMAGVPSRHGSARVQNYEGSSAGPSSTQAQEPEGPVDDSDTAYQQYSRSQREPADPFVGSPRRTPVTRTTPFSNPSISEHPAFSNSHSPLHAPAVQPASTSAFYQHNEGTTLHPTHAGSQGSEAAFSEEEYEIDSQGQFIRDSRGNKVRYQAPPSDDGSDDVEAPADRQRELAHQTQYGGVSIAEHGRGTTTTAGRTSAPSNATAGESVDYTGVGYGAGPEWAGVPRHHHPTRLSDVMEEDERSRTSASQVSQRH